MTACTLGGTTLSTVQNEDMSKDANLFIQAIPLSDGDDAFVLDIFGVTQRINVNGTYTGTDVAAVQSYAVTLKGFVAGNQSAISYVSLTSGETISVMVDNVKVKYIGGSPLSLQWELTLVQVG